MSRNRQRVRIGLIAVLLVLVAVAGYQFKVNREANRQIQLARQAIERCDFNDAGICLHGYLALEPTDGGVHLLAARTARRGGYFAAADHHLALALKHGANAAEVKLERGLLKMQKGDLAEYQWWAKICEEDPSSAETRMVLEALISGSMQATDVSLANWGVDLWLQHSSSNLDKARGLIWRGDIYTWEDQHKEAYVCYRQAVELAPDYVPAHVCVAGALILADPNQAASEMEWLRRHAFFSPRARLIVAAWRRSLGHPEEAGQLLDELLAAEPKFVPALVARAQVAIDLLRPQDAEHYLVRALELAPDDIEANVAMSTCVRLLGRLDEAQRYQGKAQQTRDRHLVKVDSLKKKWETDHSQPVTK